MLFDTHTHINDESLTDSDREALIKEIEASDLSYVLNAGANIPNSILALEYASIYSWCYSSVGIHPEYVEEIKESDMDKIREIAKSPKCVAIGEIGLDYHYTKDNMALQHFWFRKQLDIALEMNMPVIIHSRDADKDTMDILLNSGVFSKERKEKFEDNNPHIVIHCFSGSKELAKEYVKLGAFIGIDGPITFKNNRKGIEVVENTPITNLVIETDAPYLTPEPFRGTRNKAPYVKYVAEKIASIKGLTYEDVAYATLKNGKKLYNIK